MTTPGWSHPNVRLIETLYNGIQSADPKAIIACYADDAYFQDIAFQRRGKDRILEMWRLVCHGKPKVTIVPNSIAADDRTGTGKWKANYCFGRTDTNPGRKVANELTSEFVFRDGRIIEHCDNSDAMAWARQAIGLPLSLLIGSITPLRRKMAERRLNKFLETQKS